jgi:peptide/nickel transport system permease protein
MTAQTKANTDIARLNTEDQYVVSDSLLKRALRRLRRDRLTLTALAVLGILTLLTVLGPFITTNILHVDPDKPVPKDKFLPPAWVEGGSPAHLLGTDQIGRDHFARLLHGGQVSLGIGFAGSILILIIGLTLGVITGYFGGIVDDVMNWIITTLDSIPALYLLIIISAIFSPSAEALILVLALTGWTGTTRLIRGQTIGLRSLEYVTAARAVGASPWRIMFAHIVPNLISVTVISLAGGVGGLILTESALSFLRIGVQQPTPTWGNMLSDSQQYFRLGGHLVIMPGLLIFIVVLATYVIGDGIRDAFDPTVVDE